MLGFVHRIFLLLSGTIKVVVKPSETPDESDRRTAANASVVSLFVLHFTPRMSVGLVTAAMPQISKVCFPCCHVEDGLIGGGGWTCRLGGGGVAVVFPLFTLTQQKFCKKKIKKIWETNRSQLPKFHQFLRPRIYPSVKDTHTSQTMKILANMSCPSNSKNSFMLLVDNTI